MARVGSTKERRRAARAMRMMKNLLGRKRIVPKAEQKSGGVCGSLSALGSAALVGVLGVQLFQRGVALVAVGLGMSQQLLGGSGVFAMHLDQPLPGECSCQRKQFFGRGTEVFGVVGIGDPNA